MEQQGVMAFRFDEGEVYRKLVRHQYEQEKVAYAPGLPSTPGSTPPPFPSFEDWVEGKFRGAIDL